MPLLVVTVDYEQSWSERLRCFKWVNEDITPHHFPVRGSGLVKVVLHLDSPLGKLQKAKTIEEIDQDLIRLRVCSASLEHLAMLAVTYPELVRRRKIVALGSRWRTPFKDSFAPYIDEDRRGLILGLVGLEQEFDPTEWWFLTVSQPRSD